MHADRGDYLVGPDNGLLLSAAAALGGVVTAWSLDPQRLRTQAGLPAHFPATFHGRDLFAPATALLDRGLLPPLLAEPVDAATLDVPPGGDRVAYESGTVVATVVEVDRFGNVALAVSLDEVALPGAHVDVEVDSDPSSRWPARVVRTFAELQPGELGLYQDSWGNAALTLNEASAGRTPGGRPRRHGAADPGRDGGAGVRTRAARGARRDLARATACAATAPTSPPAGRPTASRPSEPPRCTNT